MSESEMGYYEGFVAIYWGEFVKNGA